MTTTPISSNPLTSSASTQHTYGLSGSGIDVDAQVKALMTAAQIPYAQLWRKEQQAEWKKAEYNTFYNSINTYNTSTVFNYTMQSYLQPQLATSSDPSKATATANADAGDISHSLIVSQLAVGVTETSSSTITPAGNSKTSLVTQFGLAAGTFNMTISDGTTSKSITVDPTQSINTFVSQINQLGLNVKANYDSTLDRFFLNTTNTGSNAKIDFTGSDAAATSFLTNNLKLSIGGTTSSASLATQFGISGSFTLKVDNTNGGTGTVSIDPATDTLQSFLDKLNAAGANLTATYNSGAADSVTISSNNGGTLNFSNISGNGVGSFLTSASALKLTNGAISTTSSAPIGVYQSAKSSGLNSLINLDGTTLDESTNNFTISGVTYNLQATGSTTVSVSTDIDKIVSNVQSFVDQYNTMLSGLYAEVNQPVYKDYLPLTDDQKSQMKDSDITAWTTKAKSGLLHNDPFLEDAINKMRNSIAEPISGLTDMFADPKTGKVVNHNSAASIGITTGDYKENGKLHLDTDKLKAALQADPSIVYKIFGTAGTSTDSSTQGIAVRLNNNLNNVISQIKTEAGTTPDISTDTESNMAQEIGDYNTRLTDLSKKLQDLQTRYYNEFDAMETALQQMNQQSSFISSLTSSSSSK